MGNFKSHSSIMGNCLESLTSHQARRSDQEKSGEQAEQQQKPGGSDCAKDGGGGGFQKDGSFRVKILLTKEELEWLLLQLQEKGGKRLEDVLGDIERGRGRGRGRSDSEGWKPSLESIMEGPEVQTIDRDGL
ncbi:hypothetical protein ACLOJK_010222 [Asimina triloba]